MTLLPTGKLPADLLRVLLDKAAVADPRVTVGPRIGEDAAIIDMGDRYLVATTDPITFASADAAWYAVHVNANDVAVRGGRPRWFLATVLLPAGIATEADATQLFGELREVCDDLEIALVGGHTEVTAGLDRVVIVGTMLGEVAKDRLVTTGGAQVGDAVVMTKGVPLEGCSLLARERGDELAARGVSPHVIRRARALLRTPGISVLPEAEIACELGAVHAMHDATEGGIATALHELAEASGVGLRIDRDRVTVLREGADVCGALGLDPLGTLASGTLLIALPPADAGVVIHALAREGLDSHFIGQVVSRERGTMLVEGGVERPLPSFPRDEIVKALGAS